MLIDGPAGRISGSAVLGGAIGLLVSVVEYSCREAWLEVNYGPNENRIVNLGQRPVRIGSNDATCDVVVPAPALEVLRYELREGRIMCEDCRTGRRSEVRPGDRRQIGAIAVTVRASGTQQPTHEAKLS